MVTGGICCVLVLCVVGALGQGAGLTPSTYVTPSDRTRLETVFNNAPPYQSTASIHYSVLGLKLLGAKLPNQQKLCSSIKSTIDENVPESLYHGVVASTAISNCKLTVSDQTKALLTAAIKPESKVLDIFHAYFALKGLGLPVDDKVVKSSLLGALTKDDLPVSYGYAFHVASQLTGDVTSFYESIEDVVAQADEIDDKFLQFEGGLYITSVVIDGSYKLAKTAKKMPTISDNKVLKFVNYLLGRKHVHQLRSSYYLLSALHTLSTNKFYTPVAVTLASPVAVSEKLPIVQVRVTGLMGDNLGEVTVTADNARHLSDDAVVVSKKPFTHSTTDKSLYELALMEVKPARGFYNIDVTVERAPSSSTPRLLGNSRANVQVKVTTQVTLETVEIGVGDADQTTAPRTTQLQHPNKAANILEADHHQKLVFKFRLRDKSSGKLMITHQSFVRLINKETEQEIIFVAEADASLLYSFDLNVGAKGKEFKHLNGVYGMELIIGDSAIENSLTWHVADIKLTFQDDLVTKKKGVNPYASKPEIKHMFREQEKRPPSLVSTAFTILVLLPLLLLLVLWAKIGVGLSNFPVSVSAIAFHLCLGAIFVLYFLYWYQLNMFETLRYLGVISVPTFLFGNRVLSTIAAKKK